VKKVYESSNFPQTLNTFKPKVWRDMEQKKEIHILTEFQLMFSSWEGEYFLKSLYFC
jgi:hypothetical protein